MHEALRVRTTVLSMMRLFKLRFRLGSYKFK